MKNSRRAFLTLTVGIVSVSYLPTSVLGQSPTKVSESDPMAQSLGYKEDAGKVDKQKFPGYAVGQRCDGCQLYQGKAGATSGACGAFQGKIVLAGGWCAAYVKKA